MGYRRVTQQDRLVIKASLDIGLSQTAIADKLGFDKSTISREIGRNTGGRGYRPKQADRWAREREVSKHYPYKMDPVMMTMIIERLELKWSPEQISNRLRVEGQPYVSAETIYKFIQDDHRQGGELWRHLRRSRRRRQRRFPSGDRRGKIQDARPIGKRASKADKRKRHGHWEHSNIEHRVTRPASPWTNGFVERFHRTLKDEFFAKAFREKWYDSLEELQKDLDAYMVRYNERRPHKGYRTKGRTPFQAFSDFINQPNQEKQAA
jgi:IS30 family transposase